MQRRGEKRSKLEPSSKCFHLSQAREMYGRVSTEGE